MFNYTTCIDTGIGIHVEVFVPEIRDPKAGTELFFVPILRKILHGQIGWIQKRMENVQP